MPDKNERDDRKVKKAIRNWSLGLLLLHLFFVIACNMFQGRPHAPVWAGSVTVFCSLMIQFTWSATVGLILGSNRRYRRWYWLTLLLIYIPLWLVRLLVFLVGHFFGVWEGILLLLACVFVLVAQTIGGIFVGLGLRQCLGADN